jgi:hypothetical protein
MIASEVKVMDQWLAKNQEAMLTCPHQPGQLKISKIACKKRYLAGQRVAGLGGDFLQATYLQGLMICRDCPIGKKLKVPAAEISLAPAKTDWSKRKVKFTMKWGKWTQEYTPLSA